MSLPLAIGVMFLLVFSVTLVFPSLPPAALIASVIHQVSGIPYISDLVLGVSGEVLLQGILNGCIWCLGSLLLYLLSRHLMRRRLQVQSTLFVASPKPRPILHSQSVTPVQPMPSSKRTIKTYVSLDQDIEMIEGIGHIYGYKLRGIGVMVVADLLREGATPRRRRGLAEKVGVSPIMLSKWVNQADFFRLRGVSTQYADLITAAGVQTIIDLSGRDPKELYQIIQATNLDRGLVRRTPPYRTVKRWIKQAERLTPLIRM